MSVYDEKEILAGVWSVSDVFDDGLIVRMNAAPLHASYCQYNLYLRNAVGWRYVEAYPLKDYALAAFLYRHEPEHLKHLPTWEQVAAQLESHVIHVGHDFERLRHRVINGNLVPFGTTVVTQPSGSVDTLYEGSWDRGTPGYSEAAHEG